MAKNNTAQKESPAEKLNDKLNGGRVRAVAGGNALPDLDRLIHERMRLGIVSALAANQSVISAAVRCDAPATSGAI